MNRRFRIVSAIFVALLTGGAGCSSPDLESITLHTGAYLHVSRYGRLGGTGEADDPINSLAVAAVEAVAGGYRGLKIDAETHYADLSLAGAFDIIGGCDRATWEPQPGVRTTIVLRDEALRGSDIRVPTLIRGLTVMAADGNGNPPTSAALHLEGCSADLRFEDCSFVGGHGFDRNDSESIGISVSDARDGEPGADRTCLDTEPGPGGNSSFFTGYGGAGGAPGAAGQDGYAVCYADSGPCPDDGSLGGAPGSDGNDGNHGRNGAPGANGTVPDGLGYFLEGSFLPFDSEDGEIGERGDIGGGGGGGGGSPTAAGGGGGGGGTGGRNGGFGEGGRAGGHSFGAVIRHSAAVFRGCTFTGGIGGDGGDGGDGLPGLPGGIGGAGGSGCPGAGVGGRGGDGGRCGDGGGGGGGNGGVSYGILLEGSVRPDLGPACVVTGGDPGTAGQGGLHGDGSYRADDGNPGHSGPVLDLDEPAPERPAARAGPRLAPPSGSS